jgi:hypothetical protein
MNEPARIGEDGRHVADQGVLILCQYKLDRFSGEEAMMALENYSYPLYRGVLSIVYIGERKCCKIVPCKISSFRGMSITSNW